MTTFVVAPAVKLICAWCKKVLREAAPGHERERPSHGICEECAARERASWPLEREGGQR